MQRKTFKDLGTLTVQAQQLAHQTLSLSTDVLRAQAQPTRPTRTLSHTSLTQELRRAAECERERLESCGELDIVGDRQPKHPPPLDQAMLGRQVEIRWRYWRPAEEGERGRKKQVIAHSCLGRTCTHAHMHTCATSEHAPHMHRCSSGAKAPWSRCRTARSASRQDPRTPFLLELLGSGGLWTDFDEQESFSWCILNPEDWNRDVHLGWRWPASEFERVIS